MHYDHSFKYSIDMRVHPFSSRGAEGDENGVANTTNRNEIIWLKDSNNTMEWTDLIDNEKSHEKKL